MSTSDRMTSRARRLVGALILAAGVAAGSLFVTTVPAEAAPPSKCYYLNGKLYCDPLVISPKIPKPNPCLSCPPDRLNPGAIRTNPVLPSQLQQPGLVR